LTTYEIDGQNFDSLEGFYDEFSRKVIPGAKWGRNLDAFNDVLFGGFGTPVGGFTLVWRNSELSRQRLSHSETVNYLREKLATCHSTAKETVRRELEAAEQGRGQTIFERLIEIIESHGPGTTLGDEPAEIRFVLA
jgi:RNAse (barnase) inhibitor barstar